jgi:lipopolysaccharide transport system ATP-binding protein
MSEPIIEVSGISKRYQLGQIGMTSLRDDVQRMGRWLTGKGRNESVAVADKTASAKEFWALRDVSFSIQPGEIVGIIGKNGAGKSTLLKILSRITEPTSGEIKLRGRVGSLLEVGTGFHPELSGRDNIFLNGAILGMKRSEIAAKFDEIVEFSEVGKFIDTPVKRYSSGMYVRLAFAIAAHLEPEILIVDEVLAVGDAQFQRKCIGRMREISQEHGRTVLFVSHSMDTIVRLCNRAILLEKGGVAMRGTPNEVVPMYYKDTDVVLSPGVSLDLRPRIHNGAGPCRFTEVKYELLGSSGENHPYPDCRIRFSVTIDSTETTTLGGLALYLETETELKVLNFDLQRHQTRINVASGRNTFTVETPPIPINAIVLRASLWMCDTSKTVVVDEVRHFCKLDFIERAGVTHNSSRIQDSLLCLSGAKIALTQG